MNAPLLSTLLVVGSVASAAEPRTWHQPDGHLALQHGVLSAPLQGDLANAGRAYLLEQREALGLPASSTLSTPRGLSTRFGGTLRYRQQVGGVDVHGADVALTVDVQRRVRRIASSVNPYSRAVADWAVTGARAMVLAARQVEGALLKKDGAPYGGFLQRFFPVGDEVHAGYLVWVPTVRWSENWHVAVDAVTGEVLWKWNRVHHASAEADVYASSPGGLSAGVGVTPLTRVTLGHLPQWAEGVTGLNGELMRAFNCCPTEGCNPSGAARRSVGQFQTYQGVAQYDFAICDRVQRASNDPAKNPAANFVYAPVDPPTTPSPTGQSAADSDVFAEVHAYHHTNLAYDFLRELSRGPLGASTMFSPFQMRDALVGKQPAVWVNANEPDLYHAEPNASGVYVSNRLTRVSNAMFVPRDQMSGVSVPEFAFDTDALFIYQGDQADFAYDAPVLWHEFGHGAIYSTADWEHFVAVDARSASLESSALHEGVADLFAAMLGQDSNIGIYVGPRTDSGRSSIRDVNNTDRCPDSLVGESHQDSRHFSGAVWEARTQHFLGSDQGRTFDAAFYAAVVSFPKGVTFERVSPILVHAVGMAFPSIPDAEAKMQAVLEARGVSKCSKVLDITGSDDPRPYYGLPGTMLAGLVRDSAIPGPYQMKVRAPKGLKGLAVNAPSYGNGPVQLQLLVKKGQPITFTRTSNELINDADSTVELSRFGQRLGASASFEVPCGEEVYFTLANTARWDRVVADLRVEVTEGDGSCPTEPSNPTEDPLTPSKPAGPAVAVDAAPDVLGAPATGCGCQGGGAAAGGWLLALLLPGVLRRRRGGR